MAAQVSVGGGAVDHGERLRLRADGAGGGAGVDRGSAGEVAEGELGSLEGAGEGRNDDELEVDRVDAVEDVHLEVEALLFALLREAGVKVLFPAVLRQ